MHQSETTSAISPLIKQHASPRTPRRGIPSTNDISILREYNTKYLGTPDYDPHRAALGEAFYSSYLSLATVGNDISNDNAHHNTLRALIPKPHQLIKRGFGPPSLSHSFDQEPTFETTYVIVLKAGFFTPSDIVTLHDTHPLLAHLLSSCVHLRTYDFRWLSEYNPTWATQTCLSETRAYAFLACLLHYDLSIANVVRFLGNNYTGAYRNITSITTQLKHLGLHESLIAQYTRVMTMGCPNHFTGSTTRANALLYWRNGNHTSISSRLDQVMVTMNKEERNNYVLHVPHWIWRFVPHCFVTPQHILIKPGKKDRQIFNASRKYDWDSIPVNQMTSTPKGTELHCEFGSVREDILVRAYNLRISYPNDDIVIHANDVKSCFRQIKHHPDVVGAFSYVLSKYLFFQIGLAFGSDFSPANWEAVRQVQSALATQLFHDGSLVSKHRDTLDKIKWCRSLCSRSKPLLTRAIKDSINPGVIDTHGRPVATPHLVYVDDDIYLDIADVSRFERAIAAGIEAIFILLGESDLTRRQDPIAWDKLLDMMIAPVNRILGLSINTRSLTVSVPPDFITEVITILRTTWGQHRRTFVASEAEVLTGKLNHIGFGAPWLKFLLGHIYSSLAHALRCNKAHLIRTSHSFRHALKAAFTAPATPDGNKQRTFHTGNAAKSMHHSKHRHFIDRNTARDLRMIEHALGTNTFLKACPIAHLIPRTPIGTARSDSCLHAAGGYCTFAAFWWYLEWPPEIQELTVRHITGRSNPKLISINALEYTTQIISMLGCYLHIRDLGHNIIDPHPVFLLECDNTQGEAWLKKGCTSSTIGRSLTRLQAALMLNNNVGYHFGRVDTKTNVIADGISQISSESSLIHEFPLLVTQAPSLAGLRRYRPNAAIVSSIMEALLQTGSTDPLTTSRQLLTDPGQFTSYPGVTPSDSTTHARQPSPHKDTTGSSLAM